MFRSQYLKRLFVLCFTGFYFVRRFDFVDAHWVRKLATTSSWSLLGFFAAGR